MVIGNTQLTPNAQTAIYGPWLQVADPISTVPGATRTLPPGGAVLGLYSQTDARVGVQKAPAGVNIPLQRVVNVELPFQNSNLDVLNTNSINVNRSVPGYGFCVMGTRTLLTSLPSRYVNIQRTLRSIQFNLTGLTQFAVFENNNENLWSRLTAVVKQYLQGIWQQGVLQGDTADQAFFVQCDGQNNTATTIAAGEVHVKVGLALNTPAEFVVIDINQMSSNSTTVTA
jgi:phage tail sheath protein FI